MIDCKKCERLIQKELDGEIKEAELNKMRAHIGECASCGEERQYFQALRKIMKEDRLVEAPPALVARLAENLPEKPRVGFFEGYVAPFLLQNRTRLAMASFVLMFAGAGLLYSYYRDTNMDTIYLSPDEYNRAQIGIRTSGQAAFVIPAGEDKTVVEENDNAVEEMENALEGDYDESGIHLAGD